MAVGKGKVDTLEPVAGVSLGIACCGIKQANRRDLVVIEMAPGATCGAVFTKNAFCAAPVTVAKKHLAESSEPRFLVINTGNANAGTGEQGIEDAIEICARLAAKRSLQPEQVLPFSTGVIGEYLPMQAIVQGLPEALDTLTPNGWDEAALGILTTDTRIKGASRQFEYQGETITVTGIAKGSGMIKPNMATMLSFVATDAPVSHEAVQAMAAESTERSFNRITVDSDTSTNDASVLMATGQAKVDRVETTDDRLYSQLQKTVEEVMLSLAHQIVKDGEGANKFVAVTVEQAATKKDALAIAYAIAESPLVKTAISASDANWGRFLMAVGKAPAEQLDVAKVDLFLDDVQIVEKGQRYSGYTEEQGAAVVEKEAFNVKVIAHQGTEADTVWTTDLSHEYIRINAEYRT